MKKKIISKIEYIYIVIFLLISAAQIIFFPLIKDKLKTAVFSEAPINKIDYFCKKEKVIKASKTSFIGLFCEKFYKN